MKKVIAAVTVYWSALLAVSLLPVSGGISREHLTVALLFAGLPVLGLVGVMLWQAARKGLGAMDLAYRDDLTGMQNRRAFLARATILLDRAQTSRLALLLLDVDGLKTINDKCGHQAGDELLTYVAQRLSGAPGSAFRIGGDEFAILVDRRKGEAVMPVLKHLEAFTTPFAACGHEHRVRLSYGFASNHEEDTFEGLFGRADSRLRRLKAELYSAGELKERRADDAEPLPESIPSIAQRRRHDGGQVTAAN